MNCQFCNSEIDPNAEFCPNCGLRLKNEKTEPTLQQPPPLAFDTNSDFATSEDKIMGALAYWGILILVPVIAGKSKFVKFHVGQGVRALICTFVLPIAAVIIQAIKAGVVLMGGDGVSLTLSLIGIILNIISYILLLITTFVPFICMICGIVNAAKGRMKPLPLIGKIGLKHK